MDQEEEFDYEAMYEEDSEYNAEGDEHWSELMPAQHIEGGPKTSSVEKSKLNFLLNQTNAATTYYSKDHSKDQANQKNKSTSLTSKTKTAHYTPYPKMSQEIPHRRENETEKKSPIGTEPHQIMDRLTQARNELKNLRQSVRGLNAQHKTDVHRLEGLLQYSSPTNKASEQRNGSQKTAASENKPDDQSKVPQQTKFNPLFQNWKPIGFMESSYMHKNGTPRQGCLVKESRGKIRILEALYTNPHHSLHGLDQHSHVWLVFAFDRNSADPSGNSHSKAKVAPPRFGGARLGVFATRSPHRPCPIGLTLAKLEAVEGSTVHVSGVDILYGTAILDIKPYIPDYDAPQGSDPDVTRKSLMQSIREASQPVHNGLDGSDDKSGLGCSLFEQPNLTGQTSGVTAGAVELNMSSSITKREKTSSKGIVITKLAPSSEYEHLLAKVTDLATSSSSSARGHSTEAKKLSTSEQLRNAERECDALGSLLSNGGNGDVTGVVKTAKWLQEANAAPLELIFNPIAERQLARIIVSESERLSLRSLIGDTLRSDPRSVYRRQRCPDLLYRCHLAAVTVTAAFLDEEGAVEVLRIAPVDQDRDVKEDVLLKGQRDDEAARFSGQTVGL